MALLIRAEELNGMISIPEAIAAVRDGFRDQGEKPAYSAPRIRIQHEDRRVSVHLGGCHRLQIAGTFIHVERFTFRGGAQQYEKAGKRVYVAYDSETAPAYTMAEFTPSTVPGCRMPHLWLSGRRSLYDAFGPGYTLVRSDPAIDVSGLVTAAVRKGFPLAVLDVEPPAESSTPLAQKLILVRPDQHVAWRGDAEPADPTGANLRVWLERHGCCP